MATFVLVPGFWLGGWVWRDVAPPLRALGHTVYTPSLTGLGDRVHLGGPEVTLETHLDDIINLIKYEELQDVLLLGHSGACMVVAGVSDRIPERLAQLIYLDTMPLPDGLAVQDFWSPEERTEAAAAAAANGGWQYPFPGWESFGAANTQGLSMTDREWLSALMTPEPWAAVVTPLTYTNEARLQLPKVGILNTMTADDVQQWVAAGVPLAKAMTEPNWRYIHFPTGHWPMVSEPQKLVETLDAIAKGEA